MVVVLPSSVLVARPKLGCIFAIIKSIELDAERGACPSGVDLLGKRSPIQPARSFRSICSHIEAIADKDSFPTQLDRFSVAPARSVMGHEVPSKSDT
jgi:hypothetical protein